MSEKKLKLNIAKLYAIDAALQSLDFYEKAVTDGDRQRPMRVFYELGALRLDLAKNRNRIKALIDDFDKARSNLIQECSGGENSIDKSHEGWKRFEAEINKMSEREDEVLLITIAADRLKLDVNPIPIVALAALADIIEG